MEGFGGCGRGAVMWLCGDIVVLMYDLHEFLIR